MLDTTVHAPRGPVAIVYVDRCLLLLRRASHDRLRARSIEPNGVILEGVTKIRSIPGNLGVQVMRRNEAGAVEYVVISYWVSRDAIKAYAGQDIEKPHHLPKDRELLLELPTRVLHYDVTYSDLAQVRVSQ